MTSFVIYALSNMPVNSVMKHDLRLRTLMAAAAAAAAANLLQSCPTLCDLIDGSPPGSPVPGILKMTTNVISSCYQFSYEIIDQVLPKYSEMQSLLGKYAEMILCLIFSKFCGL